LISKRDVSGKFSGVARQRQQFQSLTQLAELGIGRHQSRPEAHR